VGNSSAFGNVSSLDACFGCSAYADTDPSLIWHVAVFAIPDPGSLLSSYRIWLDAPSRKLALNNTDSSGTYLPEVRTGSMALHGVLAYELDVTSALRAWRLVQGTSIGSPVALRVTFELEELASLLPRVNLDLALVREPCDDAAGVATVSALARGNFTATTLPAVRNLSPDPVVPNAYVATLHACELQAGRYFFRVVSDCARPRRANCSAALLRTLATPFTFKASLVSAEIPTGPANAGVQDWLRTRLNESGAFYMNLEGLEAFAISYNLSVSGAEASFTNAERAAAIAAGELSVDVYARFGACPSHESHDFMLTPLLRPSTWNQTGAPVVYGITLTPDGNQTISQLAALARGNEAWGSHLVTDALFVSIVTRATAPPGVHTEMKASLLPSVVRTHQGAQFSVFMRPGQTLRFETDHNSSGPVLLSMAAFTELDSSNSFDPLDVSIGRMHLPLLGWHTGHTFGPDGATVSQPVENVDTGCNVLHYARYDHATGFVDPHGWDVSASDPVWRPNLASSNATCYRHTVSTCPDPPGVNVTSRSDVITFQMRDDLSTENLTLEYLVSVMSRSAVLSEPAAVEGPGCFPPFCLRDEAFVLAGEVLHFTVAPSTTAVTFSLEIDISAHETDSLLPPSPPGAHNLHPAFNGPSARTLKALVSNPGQCVDGHLPHVGSDSESVYIHAELKANGSIVHHAISSSPCDLHFNPVLATLDPSNNSRVISVFLANNTAPTGVVTSLRYRARVLRGELTVLASPSLDIHVDMNAAFRRHFLIPVNSSLESSLEITAIQNDGQSDYSLAINLAQDECDVGIGKHDFTVGLTSDAIDCGLLAPPPPPTQSGRRLLQGPGLSSSEGETYEYGAHRYLQEANLSISNGLQVLDPRCLPNRSKSLYLTDADVWLPPVDDPVPIGNATRWVFALNPNEHSGRFCVVGGDYWYLTLSPQPVKRSAVPSSTPNQVRITLSLSLQAEPLVNVVANSKFKFSDGIIVTERTGDVVSEGLGISPLYPVLPALQKVSIPYGRSRHFMVDVPPGRAGDTFLVVQMLYVPPPTSNIATCGLVGPTRPDPARLMISRETCPSMSQYESAAWWPIWNCRSPTQTVKDPQNIATGEWHQTVVIGNDVALQAGRYYITLTGGTSLNGTNVELSAALICRAGYYRPSSLFGDFTAPCLPCAQGFAKSSAEWDSPDCTECLAGTYANSTANAECLDCPPGSKQPLRGQAGCISCEIGKFRSRFSVGGSECTFCNSSTYMPLNGASACFNCPNNSETGVSGATSVKQCLCKLGYFTPYGQPGHICHRCPVGAVCEGGRSTPYPAAGFWELRRFRFKKVFVQCKPKDVCLFGGYCAPGYRGNLCGECREGYYRRGLRCYSCERGIQLSGSTTWVVLLCLMILMCLGMYFLASPEALKRSATLYVCVYFAQSLDEFENLSMSWPVEWQLVFSSMSVFNFDLQQARLDCFKGWDGMVNHVAFQFGLPLLAATIYFGFLFCYMLLLWVSRVRRLAPPIEALVRLQRSPRLLTAVDRTIGAFVALMSLMYPMLCKTTFSILSCRTVAPSLGLSYLDANPAYECFGEEHSKLIIPGIAGLLVYVLGYPLLCFYLLTQAVKSSSLDNPVFKMRFGSLYLRYERDFWYWEFIVFFRRFLVVLCLTMTSKYELMQAAGVIVIYFVATVIQDNARPYDREMVDNFEFLQLLSCHCILLCGLVYFGSERTLDITSTCDSSNGTTVSVACGHEETKIEYTKLYQLASSVTILIFLVSSISCGALTIWAQVHTVIKKQLRVEEIRETNAKFEALMQLAQRVLAPNALPAAKDWLLESTPSEQEYFKHLLQLLDDNYEDWVALQHKNMQDFLERSQEQLIDNIRFLASFLVTVGQIVCCLRARQNRAANLKQFGDKQAEKRTGVLGHFGRKKEVATVVRKRDVPQRSTVVDQEDDDLVEAYLRTREKEQARLKSAPKN